MSKSKNKILIDVNSSVPYFTTGSTTGVGRTTIELVKALSCIPNIPFEITLFSQNLKGIGGAQFGLNFRTVHFYLPLRPLFKKLSNLLNLRRLVSGYSLMHIPHNTDYVECVKDSVFTIHDLIVYRYPEMWGLTDEERKYHLYLSKNCKALTTCSESSRQDIINFLGVDPDKVFSIPWGINRDEFMPVVDDEYLNELGVNGDFYFCASCNHARKNLPLLLESFRAYVELGGSHQLVLLNPISHDLSSFDDLVKSGKIIICTRISDRNLRVLYSSAKASILISNFEGFGLPVLESLACGTNVLCANNSSLPEAGGDIVDYFDDLNVDCISRKMLLYDNKLKSDTFNKDVVERHLSNFTWVKCAQGYVDVWSKLLGIN